jgi:hypothetical protein
MKKSSTQAKSNPLIKGFTKTAKAPAKKTAKPRAVKTKAVKVAETVEAVEEQPKSQPNKVNIVGFKFFYGDGSKERVTMHIMGCDERGVPKQHMSGKIKQERGGWAVHLGGSVKDYVRKAEAMKQLVKMSQLQDETLQQQIAGQAKIGNLK